MSAHVVDLLFLVFTGAALVASLAMFARQGLIVAYVLLGLAIGPSGLALVANPDQLADMSQVGIIFLLFLLGLNLYPQKLLRMLREATLITVASSTLFFLPGAAIGLLFGFALGDSLLIGAAMMFSSTILGLKLLPTTTLHQRRMGEVVISVLLLQDLIAIVLLIFLQGGGNPWLSLSLPALIAIAFILERLLLRPLILRFDAIQEYLFLLAIGWCLGLAHLAHLLGLSHEIGAFIAGVVLAGLPVARFVADQLRPLRDFFLVLFFVALGASFELHGIESLLLPALLLTAVSLILKPPLFQRLLVYGGEKRPLAWEIGVRLGQIGEFSLLISVLALQAGVIAADTARLVQISTILSLTLSSYWVVMRYPTPIAVNERLRRD